jgi:urease accessory protein UreH
LKLFPIFHWLTDAKSLRSTAKAFATYEFFIVYRAKHATAVTRTYQEAPFRLARPFLPDPGELVTIAVTIVGAPPD